MDRELAGLRIGAYARFSSDKQSETSAAAQIARLQQWVQARGGRLSIEHTYRDERISGATNQRPGLISLMAAVQDNSNRLISIKTSPCASKPNEPTVDTKYPMKEPR